jgi:hypothetical protein
MSDGMKAIVSAALCICFLIGVLVFNIVQF